jgi:signal transduction histidine kinase/CheY-like chemotaxis protein
MRLRNNFELKDHYREHYGYEVYSEVFVTNKYGANAAATQKTSDFYQADELWWQIARDEGAYISDVEYDQSAGVHSLSLCRRIDGADGEFLGVIKALLNVQDAFDTINEVARQSTEFRTREFMLFTADHRVIHATDKHELYQRLPESELTEFLKKASPGNGLLAEKGDQPDEGPELYVFARSQGRGYFAGLGWILVVEHEAEEIFSPLARLEKRLAAVVGGIALFGLVFSFAVSRKLCSTVTELSKATEKVASGDFDVRVPVKTNDEIGALARSFNTMNEKLRQTTTSIMKLEEEVAHRKQAEVSMMNAMLQAEAANKAKGWFLANMSHEIRTPMNAIVGFSELLSTSEATDEQREYIDTICSSSRHLLALIDDILDFSMIEADKLEINMGVCSLDKILSHVVAMIEASAGEKGLEFAVIKESGVSARVDTDCDRLQQCLTNLLSNAVKYTEKGHVFLRISPEEIHGREGIRFDIEDTGIGIAEEKAKEIFDPFTQVDASSTRKYGGVGLGLGITKRLTRLLGGELTFISEEGKGSVFTLVIPTGLEEGEKEPPGAEEVAGVEVEAEEEAVEEGELAGIVLVAEDVMTNQVLAEALLTRMGLQVVIANDGNEAIQKALSRRFDLILMDIQMPNVNGYEATAHAMKGDEQKCIDAGCDDYIAKPINRKNLFKKLSKYLPAKQPALAKGAPPE